MRTLFAYFKKVSIAQVEGQMEMAPASPASAKSKLGGLGRVCVTDVALGHPLPQPFPNLHSLVPASTSTRSCPSDPVFLAQSVACLLLVCQPTS